MAVKSILNTTTLIQWFGIAFLILLALLIMGVEWYLFHTRTL